MPSKKIFKVSILLAYIHVQGQETWNQYQKVMRMVYMFIGVVSFGVLTAV